MTLWYNFGSDDYNEFEYDVSLSQLRDFFMSLPSEELVDAFQQAYAEGRCGLDDGDRCQGRYGCRWQSSGDWRHCHNRFLLGWQSSNRVCLY